MRHSRYENFLKASGLVGLQLLLSSSVTFLRPDIFSTKLSWEPSILEPDLHHGSSAEVRT